MEFAVTLTWETNVEAESLEAAKQIARELAQQLGRQGVRPLYSSQEYKGAYGIDYILYVTPEGKPGMWRPWRASQIQRALSGYARREEGWTEGSCGRCGKITVVHGQEGSLCQLCLAGKRAGREEAELVNQAAAGPEI